MVGTETSILHGTWSCIEGLQSPSESVVVVDASSSLGFPSSVFNGCIPWYSISAVRNGRGRSGVQERKEKSCHTLLHPRLGNAVVCILEALKVVSILLHLRIF